MFSLSIFRRGNSLRERLGPDFPDAASSRHENDWTVATGHRRYTTARSDKHTHNPRSVWYRSSRVFRPICARAAYVSACPSVGACTRVRTIMLAADGFGDRRRRGR